MLLCDITLCPVVLPFTVWFSLHAEHLSDFAYIPSMWGSGKVTRWRRLAAHLCCLCATTWGDSYLSDSIL